MTTETMAMPRCSMSMFTASLARAPESRVMVTFTWSGISSPLRLSSFSSMARVTNTALEPRFLASAMDTAGISVSAPSSFACLRPAGP